MTAINEAQFTNTVTSVQSTTVETDAINDQISDQTISDQAIASLNDAMKEAFSDSDMTELTEAAHGTHPDSNEANEGKSVVTDKANKGKY